MLSHLKPQVVFIDEHLSHYFPYIQSIVPNCYLINTKLPSGKSKRVPPFNSSYIPTNNIFGEIICEVIWISHLFTKRLTRLTTSVAFLGCPNEYFQRRYLHRSKSKIQFTDKTSMYDYDNIIDVPSIHLMSDMFEFSWRKPKANEINMHSWNHSDENLNDSLSEIILKNHSEKSIVYCGLGTMASSNLTQYSRFISRLIDALSQSKHHLLIISTGSVKLTSQCSTAASELPNHVYIFDQVPQRALLAHCSIMITHGGLNSIKECIDCCVPMLGIINHAHKHKDTLGNIARIVFHKIGLRCMVTDKPSVLLQRVDKLLSDLRFKKNILYLKDKIDNESKKNVFTLNGIGNTI